ncbi:hypothetical protein GW17_00018664 [Ensete ventricosum]|nr:hypothetical protein GW17_00018664 [Ensete ventricosum]RZR82974.1 hypothetical protein BHM03_00009507 [Ensete ventricosum]
MECYFCHHLIGVSMFTEKEIEAQLAVFISPAPRKGEWWGRMAPVISAGTKLLGEEEEVSSGCQSGWTAYLEDEEEEEDLSMVSDASSGPPQLREEDEQRYRCHRKSSLCVGKIGCLCPVSPSAAAMARDGCKKRRVLEEQHIEHSSALVDTATSPLFSYSKACFGATLLLL